MVNLEALSMIVLCVGGMGVVCVIGFVVSLIVGIYRLFKKKESSVLVCGSLISLFLIDFCILVLGLLTYEPGRYAEFVWCAIGMPVIAWWFHVYCEKKNDSV